MECKNCSQRERCDLAIKDLNHPDIKCNKYKTVDNFAHTACGILPNEHMKAESVSEAERILQTKPRVANYATVEESYNKVQLPCLPGDDVYWIDEMAKGGPKVVRDPAAVEAVCYYGNGEFRVICHGDGTPEKIGTKFCYLTREDAERGLREMMSENEE